MTNKLLSFALASASLLPSAAAAQTVSGIGGGSPLPSPPSISGPATNSGPGGFGAFSKGNMSDTESDIRNIERNNSKGEDSSAATRISSSTPALSAKAARTLNEMFPGTRATTNVRSGSLAGVKTGMLLWSNGASVGLVQQIRTADDGSVAMIIVEGANGGFFAVPAEKLGFSGGALTTSMRLAGVNAAKNAAMETAHH
jgi:hypothetical protein